MPSERYGSPIYLTLDDVQRIYNADLSSFPHLAVQRDILYSNVMSAVVSVTCCD